MGRERSTNIMELKKSTPFLVIIGFLFLITLVGAIQNVFVDVNHNNNSIYNVSQINSTIYYGNGSQMNGVITGTEGDLNVNSSTWWAGVSDWVSGWFVQIGNNLDFNETKLNETIDARDSDTTYTNGSGLGLSGTTFSVLFGTNFLGWGNLTSYPTACSSSQYISVFGDSLTCVAISIAISQITDIANANVNSSNWWDGLNTPSDINAADITDDNTYVQVAGDTMTGQLGMGFNTLLQPSISGGRLSDQFDVNSQSFTNILFMQGIFNSSQNLEILHRGNFSSFLKLLTVNSAGVSTSRFEIESMIDEARVSIGSTSGAAYLDMQNNRIIGLSNLTGTPDLNLEIQSSNNKNISLIPNGIGIVKIDGNIETTGNLTLSSGKIDVTNPASTNAFKIDQNGDAGSSTSTGGAFLLENTGNIGAGIIIYSNIGATASGRLLNIRADNAAFDQAALHVDYDGNANAVELVCNTNDSSSQCLNIVSVNEEDTPLGIIGSTTGKGIVKITHNKPGASDSSASAISIDLAGAGTAAQGIFIDSTGITTGDFLNIRNNGIEQFVVDAVGKLFALDWTNVTITESQVSNLVHTTDTNASTACTGTTTYLDGEENCDDISSVYEPISAHFDASTTVNITCFDSICNWYTNATDSCMYWPSGGKDCGA